MNPLNDETTLINSNQDILMNTDIMNTPSDVTTLMNTDIMNTPSDVTTLINSNQDISMNTDTLSYILTNNTPTDDDYNTLTRKINYREIEYEKLKRNNSIINYIYYILVFLLLLLLYSEDNLFLKDRFLFYLFLVLLPYLYPWVYSFLGNLWSTTFPNNFIQGPKNAFINNIDTNLPYDI